MKMSNTKPICNIVGICWSTQSTHGPTYKYNIEGYYLVFKQHMEHVLLPFIWLSCGNNFLSGLALFAMARLANLLAHCTVLILEVHMFDSHQDSWVFSSWLYEMDQWFIYTKLSFFIKKKKKSSLNK